MKHLKVWAFAAVLLSAAVVAGCGKSSSKGITITGTVWDSSTSTPQVVPGALVTLHRASDSSAIETASSDSSGYFTLNNVPGSQDIYLNVGKQGYVSFNQEVINISASEYRDLWIGQKTGVQQAVDMLYGSSGSSWDDPTGPYLYHGWFFLDIYDSSGNLVSGVTVSSSPTDLTVLYINNMGAYVSGGPTIIPSGTHATASQVGGWTAPATPGSTAAYGVYTLTLSDLSTATTKTVKLPLVPGEMTYFAEYPW